MKLLNNIKRVQFYLWVGLAYFLCYLLSEAVQNPESFLVRSVNTLWRTPYLVAINFIFFEYILPSLKHFRKRILRTFSILLFQIFLCSFGLYAWRLLGIQLHIHTSLITYSNLTEAFSTQFSIGLFSIFFFAVIRHVYLYIKLKQATQLLRIEKQQAELNYLKSQTNPHFLFNTLNNIYALAKDKSDLAPESILRLSKILRFMLYETGGDYISIENEVKIIGDYIALEKLRYDDSLIVNFNFEIADMKQPLPPLLLIPLVENAFKHGVSETRNKPFIEINLSVNEKHLDFNVKNSTEKISVETGVKENIGLYNLRRQLELLYRDFNLSVQQEENSFTAILKINLSSHV